MIAGAQSFRIPVTLNMETRAWSRKWQPTLVFLPGKFPGQGNLVGYSPWSLKELDTTEHTHTHTHTYTWKPESGLEVTLKMTEHKDRRSLSFHWLHGAPGLFPSRHVLHEPVNLVCSYLLFEVAIIDGGNSF